MAWDYNTIASATPATTLANRFKTAMESEGYTEVDDYTSGTERYRVWNSGNGFHIILNHATAGTGPLTMRLCETYNSTNHTTGYIAINVSSVTPYLRSDYGYASSFNGSASGFGLTGPTSFFWNTNTTGFTYGVTVTPSRIIAVTYVGSSLSGWHYAGKFDTLLTGENAGPAAVVEPGPYCIATRSQNFWTVACTRCVNPERAGVDGSGFFNYSHLDLDYVTGVPSNYSKVFDGIMVSRLVIQGGATGTGYGTNSYQRRGILKGVVKFQTDGSYAFADELTVNGSPKYKVVNDSYAIEMA